MRHSANESPRDVSHNFSLLFNMALYSTNMPTYKISDMKYADKNIQSHGSMGLLPHLLHVFLLNSSDRRISKSEKCCYIFKCVITVTIIGLFDAYCLFWKIENIFSTVNPSIVATDVTQMSYDYVQYIVDLIFIYNYGTEIIQEYLKNFESIDKILGMTHENEIQSRLSKLTAMFLFFWLIVSAFDFMAWYLGYGILTPVFYSLAYFFLLIKILTNLDLTLQVYHVECRLRVIGDFLQECYKKTDSLTMLDAAFKMKDNIVCNKNWFYGKGCNRAEEMNSKPSKGPMTANINCSYKVQLLTRCYILIREQCMFINKMFGFRILLNSLSLLIDMVRFLNVVVRISIGTQKTLYVHDLDYLPAISTFTRFLICVAILTSLVHHCERAYDHTDRIVSVINHILVNRNPDEALRASLTDLRGLVSSRPVCFNMCNFFRLGYPYLVSTISVVVTYTIILLQNT